MSRLIAVCKSLIGSVGGKVTVVASSGNWEWNDNTAIQWNDGTNVELN